MLFRSEIAIVPNETVYFDSSQMVLSALNENGTKSLNVFARMITNNDSVSPVIDTARFSATTIKNRVDNFTQSTKNLPTIDDVSVISATGGFVLTYTSSNSTGVISVPVASRTTVKNITVGKYITISGGTSNVNGTFLVTALAADGSSITITGVTTTVTEAPASLTIVMKDNFVSEIAPFGGSAVSKYVTRLVNFATASTFLKIMFSANVPAVADSDIQVYYK